MNRRTALYSWHVDQQARMVPFAGWDMPVQYSGILAEHKAVRTTGGVFDVSHMARIRIGGPDALALLEYLFTNRVGTMKPDQVRYGFLCDESGGTWDDILVYRWASGYSVVANASNHEVVLDWLRQHAVGRDVEIRDQTTDTAMIAVQGPNAIGWAQGLFDVDVSSLRYYFATTTQYGRTPCVVSRTGYTGEDGFEAIVPNEAAVSLWTELHRRGAVPCGLGARDTLRLEAGMPLYGHELSRTIDPIRAGLSWAVKLDKGEFVGRAALTAAAQSNTRPIRIGLELEGKRAAREGFSVLRDGTSVGTVTSGSYAPTLEKSIAMAFVEPSAAAVGTQLAVDIRGTTSPARVVSLPFYKRP